MIKKETAITLRLGGIIALSAVVASVITGVATYAFTYGYFQREQEARAEKDLAMEKQIERLFHLIEVVEQKSYHYTDTEVGGLRADWERELAHEKDR